MDTTNGSAASSVGDAKREAGSPAPASQPSAKRPRVGKDSSPPEASSSAAPNDSAPTKPSEDVEMGNGSESDNASKAGDSKKGKKQQRKGRATKGKGWARVSRKDQDGEAERRREAAVDADGQPLPKAPRYPKRQCALLLGFCGSGYNGMQIQPQGLGLKTIEGTLFDALVKVGAVSQDNSDNPSKVALARAARTDAGVHAAGNVVSLKLIMEPPGISDLVEAVNNELPPEIRFWGFGRVQNSFNARLVCESRKYTYFFPSYMLLPPKPGSGMQKALAECSASILGDKYVPQTLDDFWVGHEGETEEEAMVRKRNWRVGSDRVQKLREIVKKYEGSHNFHNFTVKRDFTDRSCNRYMKSIQVEDPVVYGDTEWISVLFHGQSFMLHQRKMMSGLVLSCRYNTPIHMITELYNPKAVSIPKMPALGLLLEEPLFENYNKRMEANNEKLSSVNDPEYRPVIDFDIHREKMNAFKEEFIYKNMRSTEDRDGIFDAWIRMLDSYSGNDLLYFNTAGVIPDATVVKKGVKRANPFREKRIFDLTNFSARDDVKEQLAREEDEEEDEEATLDKRQLEEMEG